MTNRFDRLCVALLALFACAPHAAAQTNNGTVNFNSLETMLADDTDMVSMKSAMWVGWATQVYEYNMPYIEVANDEDSATNITSFEISIGDTLYNFGNEFFKKEETNSAPYPANGEFALTGFATPDVNFTASISDDGDMLIIDFLDGGIAPGERAIFQVDINPDAGEADALLFKDYTSVFFTPNGGDDTSGNSVVSVGYADGTTLSRQLPNPTLSDDAIRFLTTPRPYSEPQPQVDLEPFELVPEPTAGLLAALALAGAAARRRG